jgi:hypothetical protein
MKIYNNSPGEDDGGSVKGLPLDVGQGGHGQAAAEGGAAGGRRHHMLLFLSLLLAHHHC